MKLNQILQEGLAGRGKRTRFKWPGKRWIVVDLTTGKFASSRSDGYTNNLGNVKFWDIEDLAKDHAEYENNSYKEAGAQLIWQRERDEQEAQSSFEDWANEVERHANYYYDGATRLTDKFGPPSTWDKKNPGLKKLHSQFKSNAKRRLKKKIPTNDERYVARSLTVIYEY